MIKWFIKKRTIRNWNKQRAKANKEDRLFNKALLLTSAFPTPDYPVTLYETNGLYISTTVQTLEVLEVSLKQYKEEFLLTNFITPRQGIESGGRIRLNTWITKSTDMRYLEKNIYVARETMGIQIKEMYEHAVRIDRVSYAERSVRSLLRAYIELTTILGDQYGR